MLGFLATGKMGETVSLVGNELANRPFLLFKVFGFISAGARLSGRLLHLRRGRVDIHLYLKSELESRHSLECKLPRA